MPTDLDGLAGNLDLCHARSGRTWPRCRGPVDREDVFDGPSGRALSISRSRARGSRHPRHPESRILSTHSSHRADLCRLLECAQAAFEGGSRVITVIFITGSHSCRSSSASCQFDELTDLSSSTMSGLVEEHHRAERRPAWPARMLLWSCGPIGPSVEGHQPKMPPSSGAPVIHVLHVGRP